MRKITRRQFLKQFGVLAVGATVSTKLIFDLGANKSHYDQEMVYFLEKDFVSYEARYVGYLGLYTPPNGYIINLSMD